MIRQRVTLGLAAALLVAGCGDADEPAPQPSPAGPLAPGQAKLPPQASDFPALASKDCVEVAQFYFEAIGGHEFDQAALVWDDPVIDGARLEALFGEYKEPQIAWTEPFVEGAAGTLHCTISGALTDAADPKKVRVEGTLLLQRTNDVPGATADQLRWTIRSSTFLGRLERSQRG